MRKRFFIIFIVVTLVVTSFVAAIISSFPAHAGGNGGDEFLGRLSDAEVRSLGLDAHQDAARRDRSRDREVAAFVLGLGLALVIDGLDQDHRQYRRRPSSSVQSHAKDCAEWLHCGGGRLLREGDYCPPPYLRYGEWDRRWYCVD